MRSTIRAVVCGFSIMSLSLLASPGAVAQTGVSQGETTASWTLADPGSRVCVDAAYGRKSYVIAFPSGHWDNTLTIGLQALPPGSTSSEGVIAPGSSDGSYGLGGVTFDIPPTPIGVYDAAMWATDGRVRRSMPVTIDVKARCW
jgi:hypothetical protein